MLNGPSFVPEVVSSALIMLHGFGSNGDDLIGLAPYISGQLPNTAIYAPNGVAPTPFAIGYQWFNDNDWTFRDRHGMDIAQREIEKYIDYVKSETGLTSDRIVLLGFSQGTMTALFVAPRMKEPLAALIGLSGRMFWDEELADSEYQKMPVCLIHGLEDDVVDPKSSPEAEGRLRSLGFDVDVHMIEGLGHGIDEQALSKVITCLKETFK